MCLRNGRKHFIDIPLYPVVAETDIKWDFRWQIWKQCSWAFLNLTDDAEFALFSWQETHVSTEDIKLKRTGLNL